MLIKRFDEIVTHDKNPTRRNSDFNPYPSEYIPLKTAIFPLNYMYYPIKSVLQAAKIFEESKLSEIHGGVEDLRKLITWYDRSVLKLNSESNHEELRLMLKYGSKKISRPKYNSNSNSLNAKILQAIYYQTRIQSQKIKIFMENRGISTYTKFLDRFLRAEFYLDFAKDSQDKTIRDKAKKESIYLSESFGSPNKGLNHASARTEFNFIIKATHKIPRLNYSWISSLIDIVFFKGIAKANGLEASLKNMRNRVSIEQLKKENPKWHICDFFAYTNLKPSEQVYYRQENYKSCPFCYATIKAALRSKYGYTQYTMRTFRDGSYHKGTTAYKKKSIF